MVNEEKVHTITTTTIEDNQNHHKTSPYPSHTLHRNIATAIVIILILVGITALILYLLYHPHNPKFTVVAATVYGTNTTSPPGITAMQFTIITRNPNNRVSIHYDRFTTFLAYENHPITPPLVLPPLSHARDSTVAMSPIWAVSPTVVDGLVSDEVGAVSLRVVLTGSLRWKAGSLLTTRRKGVFVGCDVLVGLKNGVLGPVPLAKPSVCRVDV